jgi:adenylate kinase family enzyme
MDTAQDKQPDNLPLGRRIHVIGNSCSGKSTLAQEIASGFDIPLVELDALNWEANWVGLNETNPTELERRMEDSTNSNAWVVAG